MPKKGDKSHTSPARAALAAKRAEGKAAYAGGRTSQRTNAVRTLLGRGWPGARIVEYLSNEWKVSTRAVETYVRFVREENRRDFEENRPNALTDMILRVEAHYADCMKKGLAAAAGRDLDRLIALQQLNVQRVELSGPGGGAIETHALGNVQELSDEEVQVLAKLAGITAESEPTQH